MDIREFYTLDSKLSSSTVQVQAIGLDKVLFKDGVAAQWHIVLGDYSGITFPVIFKQMYGKKLDDILDTGWPSLLLISNNLKETLDEHNLTGWRTFDVKVLDKQNNEVHGYYGLSITGRCGEINYKKSEVIEKRLVPNGPLSKYYKGLHIDLNRWDGSDFFLPAKNFGIIVTSKTADLLKGGGFTNIKLKNLTDIETSEFALPRS